MGIINNIQVNNMAKLVRMKLKIMKFGSLGSNVRFGGVSSFYNTENIYISNDVFIGAECYFDAVSNIIISSGCMIGPRVFCVSGSHNYNSKDLKAVPFDNRQIDLPVIIDSNVWIAGNVSIAPGSHIGEGSVIAMGALVAGEIPPFSVVVGDKAQPKKTRDIEKYKSLVKQQLIYNNVFAGKGFKLIQR